MGGYAAACGEGADLRGLPDDHGADDRLGEGQGFKAVANCEHGVNYRTSRCFMICLLGAIGLIERWAKQREPSQGRGTPRAAQERVS